MSEMVASSDLAVNTDQVASGSPKTYSALIDGTTPEANFLLNGISGSVDMALYRPDGMLVSQSDPDVTFTGIANARYFQIASPVSGVWQVQITGDGEFTFSASGNSSIGFDYLSDTSLPADEEANLRVLLTGPIGSATFTFTHKDGASPETVSLFDDGLHGDDEAGDGVYGGTWTPTEFGEFRFHVQGTTTEGSAFEQVIAKVIKVKPAVIVLSSLRASPNPTSASSVDFMVAFSKPVTGVDVSDFALTTTGISGAFVSAVNGSDSSYTVTVNTGIGTGDLRLDVLDDNTIVGAALNPLSVNSAFTSGETYSTTDRTAPTVLSSVRASANPTNAASVNFTVTFSESVAGVDTSDFRLTTSGVSGATVSGVSGSGSSYTVTVNTGIGAGTIRLDVADDDTIKDAADNPLGGTGIGNGNFTNGEVYTFDNIAPTVVSSVISSAYNGNVYFIVTFSESVTGVYTSSAPFNDFTLTTTGGVSGATVSAVSYYDSAYTVSYPPCGDFITE